MTIRECIDETRKDNEKNKVTIMEAISEMCRHRSKNDRMCFDIVFYTDYDKNENTNGKIITIEKQWDKELKDWVYAFKEPYCLDLDVNENITINSSLFLAKVFNAIGKNLEMASNNVNYEVFRGYYEDPVLRFRKTDFRYEEDYADLLRCVRTEIKREYEATPFDLRHDSSYTGRLNALRDFYEDIKTLLIEKYAFIEEYFEKYECGKEEEEKER